MASEGLSQPATVLGKRLGVCLRPQLRKQSGRDGAERVVAAARPDAKLPKQPEPASKPAAKESPSQPAPPARNEAKGDARYRPPGPIIQKVWDVDTGCP